MSSSGHSKSTIPSRLQPIIDQDGNKYCADCNIEDPEWASLNLGVVICIDCVGCHRAMGTHISKVRSITLDEWSSDQLRQMKGKSNTSVNAEYQAIVPPVYLRPSIKYPSTLREQFIRAKYERKEFTNSPEGEKARQVATAATKEGLLLKRGKDNNKWPERFCVMDGTSLIYFGSKGDAKPKGVIPLSDAFLDVWPTGIEQQHSFSLIHCDRVYFFSALSATELWNWILILRSAQVRLYQGDPLNIEPFPPSISAVVDPPVFRGSIFKQGPKEKGWKKRWLVLYGRLLLYFEDPTCSAALGGSVLGSRSKHFDVDRNYAKDQSGRCFSVTTPTRVYHFKSDIETEAAEWVEVLSSALDNLPSSRLHLSFE